MTVLLDYKWDNRGFYMIIEDSIFRLEVGSMGHRKSKMIPVL